MSHKQLTGYVTSTKNDKTITVTVTTRETHPIYGKQYSVSRKFAAHDEKAEANVGDKVVIVETRPISKSKRFKLHEIQVRSQGSVELKAEVNEAVADKADLDHDEKEES